jgi:rSAM/selenodomain-associated transferase 1
MDRALLVVAKRPVPGQTKTRLCPPLAPDQAAQLYECFLLDTLELCRSVQAARMIAYLPPDELDYFWQLAPDFELLPQIGESLGERLDNALTHCLSNGFDQAVIMDSDSPTLPSEYVAQAFEQLAKADTVLGPCDDGGYYLIGLKRPQPRLLRQVQMSTPSVLRDTLALAEQVGLRVSLLPAWYDVDTIQELQRLRDELRLAQGGLARHTWMFMMRDLRGEM